MSVKLTFAFPISLLLQETDLIFNAVDKYTVQISPRLPATRRTCNGPKARRATPPSEPNSGSATPRFSLHESVSFLHECVPFTTRGMRYGFRIARPDAKSKLFVQTRKPQPV